MSAISFDKLGFKVDGKDAFMMSGEFHYFRVPPEDWARRMDLFIEAGGNCIATYVPWLLHERKEGQIVFGDVKSRDLRAFLTLAQEKGLKVILRPGPYQYSELDNDGLPDWLLEEYPEVLAKDVNGKAFRNCSISYLHPVFLEKARSYYRAFADQVRPFMAENGGPVAMLQVDNEMAGIHLWFGSMDYNPDTMGFGKSDGRYPRYLAGKYGTIEELNAAYGTDFADFASVRPVAKIDRTDIAQCRRLKDYSDFYRGTLAEYACLLRSWLHEDGLGGPICHNSANYNMNCLFEETVKAMGEGFLLGSDHYYTLNADWPQNNPTPQYALNVLRSCDTMRVLGMPPSVLELPGGSPSDTPPILPEDLLACYMTNVALGAKSVNFYVYTGGPNFEGCGNTCDIYDYNAIIHADGSLNETYDALKTFGGFMKTHGWMQRAHRVASVQVGFEWNTFRSADFDDQTQQITGSQTDDFIMKGLLYTLMCSCYSPEMKLLTDDMDVSRPLIVPCASAMSAAAQTAVAEFVRRGGQALILPVLPETDLEGRPCTILKDALGLTLAAKPKAGHAVCAEGVGNVFGLTEESAFVSSESDVLPIAKDVKTGNAIGVEMALGAGKVIWFGARWHMTTFPQAKMTEMFMARLGAKKCVKSSNRNIFTALWQDEEGRRELFIMNLYSAPQKTELWLGEDEEPLGEFELKAMEVRTIDL